MEGWGQAHAHPASPPTDSSEGALEGMVRGLRLGGVSFLGRPQPLTHEQWRSSFMRRNRDPQLNERAHRVRALQSTLKVGGRRAPLGAGLGGGHRAPLRAGLGAFGSVPGPQPWALLWTGLSSRFLEPGSRFEDGGRTGPGAGF